MVRRLMCVLLVLGLLCINGCAEGIYDAVRLHVAAQDDSPAAQALKRELRNTCLRCAEVCIGDAEDVDAAYMRLERHAEDFRAACRERARELGYTGKLTAETGVFEFPDRLYGRLLAPAGEYRALRITIGEGEGHNWWCILYPTICRLNEEDAVLGEVQAKKVLEWLGSRIGGWLG